ncbi:hypothetical protein BGY98DRAFT_1052579 [Russula aff. rugulosa BPL654]|nr:hypothetical protein BGY98DRAFT_1052579 [Russula aff. rugulosa BPL654]
MTSVPRLLTSPSLLSAVCAYCTIFLSSSALYSALASALSVPSRQVPFACLVLRRRNCSPCPCKAKDSASIYAINVVCFLITSALTGQGNWYFWYP